MIDASILESIASAAAHATGGMAVRASAPGWKKLLAKYKPDPRALRKNPLWRDTKLSNRETETITRYLNSTLCQGLLQILAYILAVEPDQGYELQAAQLGDAFSKELLARFDASNDTLRRTTHELWKILKANVELYARNTMDGDYYAENKFLAEHLTSRRAEISGPSSIMDSGPSASKTRKLSTAGKRKLTIAAIVSDRGQLADNYHRSIEAIRLAQEIRESARSAYGHIVMPHARDDYRIRLEDLYVERNITYISDQELENLHIGIFGSGNLQTPEILEAALPEIQLDDHRYVLIGSPGAGKSTFVRHLLYESCKGDDTAGAVAPLVVELKGYASAKPRPFQEIIAERIRYMEHIDAQSTTVADLLTLGYGFVVFDGLDEITNLSRRRQAVHSIESFARRFPLVKIIVTSRPEGYSGAKLNQLMFSAYRLPDFTESQVADYAYRWFELTTDVSGTDSKSAAAGFLRDSAAHATDLRINPLMLSLLCMVYRYVGYIPENRPRIYEECTELLFERWDTVRHVRPDIDPDTKGRFLVQELAHYFFTHQASQGGVEEHILLQILQEYLRRNVISDIEVARNRARDFLNYCAGRAWVLTMIGTSPKGQRVFGFTHRTFMEYFVACYLVRQHSDVREFIASLREYIRQGSSDVVPEIAIQRYDEMAADGVDDCLSVLLFDSTNLTDKVQCGYLPFAVRCSKFMRPSPRTLNKIFEASIRCYLTSRSTSLFGSFRTGDCDYDGALERFCGSVVGNDSRDDEAFGLKVGCYRLLLGHDTPWAGALISQLEDKLIRDLNRFKVRYPDMLTILLQRNRITIDQFLATCPAHQLVETSAYVGTGSIKEQGALLQEFNNLTEDISPDSSLRAHGKRRRAGSHETISYLFSDPSLMLPLGLDTAQPLISALEGISEKNAGIREYASTLELSGLRAFALVVILACIELDWPPSPSMFDLTGGTVGRQSFERLRRLRSEALPLDRESLSRMRRLHIGEAWIDFMGSWTVHERSVIEYED